LSEQSELNTAETPAAAALPVSEPPVLRRARWGVFSGGLFVAVSFFLPFVSGCVPIEYVDELIEKAGSNHDFRSFDTAFVLLSRVSAFLFPYVHGLCIALCALFAWREKSSLLANVLLAIACLSIALDSVAQFQWYCDVNMDILDTQFTLTPHNIGPLFMLGWLIVGLQIVTVKNAKDGRAKILRAAATALLPNFVWHAHFAGRSNSGLAIGWFLGVAATILYTLCAYYGLRAIRKLNER
jgi:hypothetical protein